MSIQAENAIDRMDWMDKITGVIASLLNNQVPEQVRKAVQIDYSAAVNGVKLCVLIIIEILSPLACLQFAGRMGLLRRSTGFV